MSDKGGESAAPSTRERLVAEIYEVALRPELYGSFMELWEKELAAAVAKLESLDQELSGRELIDDPEIAGHFRRAYLILEQIGRSRTDDRSDQSLVNRETGAAMLFDGEGRLKAANRSAETRFGPLDMLSSLAEQMSPADYRALSTLLRRLARPQAVPEVHLFALAGPDAENASPVNSAMMIARAVQRAPGELPDLMVSEILANWPAALDRLLKRSFALTDGEIAVTRLLLSGISVKEIAARGDRSEHTVRTQLKAILRKTGSSTQSDLVRMISILARHAEDGAINVPNIPSPAARRRWVIDLSGSRQMPVEAFGAANGRPVLFIHGMLDGFAFNPKVDEMLAQAGLYFIAPTRPGFGTCNTPTNKPRAPQEFAEDAAAILDALGIGKCLVLGHMAGAIYAYAAAAQMPDRITRVVNVAGAVPIVSLKQFSAMSARQRLVAWTARFTPGLLPTILRAGIAQIDTGGEEAFMNDLYKESPSDQILLADPFIRASVLDGYRFAVAQGHHGFETDSMHVTRNWSAIADSVSQPVNLYHGSLDHVVSIASVRAFAQDRNNVSLTEFEDAGQLVLVGAFDRIADTLNAFNE